MQNKNILAAGNFSGFVSHPGPHKTWSTNEKLDRDTGRDRADKSLVICGTKPWPLASVPDGHGRICNGAPRSIPEVNAHVGILADDIQAKEKQQKRGSQYQNDATSCDQNIRIPTEYGGSLFVRD
ncbi:MAG: hypothetical protein AB7U97_28935 [Pirellulales bacterium]